MFPTLPETLECLKGIITVKRSPSQVGSKLALGHQTHTYPRTCAHAHVQAHSPFIPLGKEEAGLPVGAAKRQMSAQDCQESGGSPCQA